MICLLRECYLKGRPPILSFPSDKRKAAPQSLQSCKLSSSSLLTSSTCSLACCLLLLPIQVGGRAFDTSQRCGGWERGVHLQLLSMTGKAGGSVGKKRAARTFFPQPRECNLLLSPTNPTPPHVPASAESQTRLEKNNTDTDLKLKVKEALSPSGTSLSLLPVLRPSHNGSFLQSKKPTAKAPLVRSSKSAALQGYLSHHPSTSAPGPNRTLLLPTGNRAPL